MHFIGCFLCLCKCFSISISDCARVRVRHNGHVGRLTPRRTLSNISCFIPLVSDILITLTSIYCDKQAIRCKSTFKTYYDRSNIFNFSFYTVFSSLVLFILNPNPIRSNALLGEFKPVYFYNLECMVKVPHTSSSTFT